MSKRIGFVSTRFAGHDGVSLEAAKWADVLQEREGHTCLWYAGRLDRPSDKSLCVPEAFFGHPENEWINERIWGQAQRTPLVSDRIHELARYLKSSLYEFDETFDIDLYLIQNAVSIPMHVPLGLAITEFLQETQKPGIAHHHDFYWERERFSINAVTDFLDMAFPPRLPNLSHVVINKSAQEELSWRKGLPSTLLPNVLDFENPPPEPDEYASDVREMIGLSDDDVMILQPTRVVPRKGIEHAVDLVEGLGDDRYKLVVSHEVGDEGSEYAEVLRDLADDAGVDIRFISTRIGDYRQRDSRGRKIYRLWDLYPHADLVTYPSLYEGFGNAFLEAVYFRIPMLVNRYANYIRDIEPKGFDVLEMDGIVTPSVVQNVNEVLEDPERRGEMVEHNYRLARRHYSYSVLQHHLRTLVTEATGEHSGQPAAEPGGRHEAPARE
ncbi:MAG: glycosyltransferase family 4 protein [Planctomycetota bacterium]